MKLIIVDGRGNHQQRENVAHVPRIGEKIAWRFGNSNYPYHALVEQVLYDFVEDTITVAVD